MNKPSRNIIAYFLESKLWKAYETDILTNIEFWKIEDPAVAFLMESSRKENKIGLTIEEYIYGMLDCTYKSKLSMATKRRIFEAINDIEKYHRDNGTSRLIV